MALYPRRQNPSRLILFIHLHLRTSSGYFPKGFTTKTLLLFLPLIIITLAYPAH
jgi:hypothetical protein